MGADLYCNGYEKHYQTCKPQMDALYALREKQAELGLDTSDVDAKLDQLYGILNGPEWYFRDSYNDSSVFWKLGLSWWQDLKPYYVADDEWTNDVNVGPEGCLALAKRIESQPLNLDDVPDPEEHLYFVEKKARLIRFLRCCAAAGGMFASV